MVTLARTAPLDADRVREMLLSITPPTQREVFETRRDSDFSYEIQGLARFRCNLFMDRKGMGGVFRVIPAEVLTAEGLDKMSAVANYWQRQIFSGRGTPPPIKESDAEVIAFVAANPGAIGYVSADAEVSVDMTLTLKD